MLMNTKDEQKEFEQPLNSDIRAQEGVSIFQLPLDDKLGLPFCYFFEGCWIEFNLVSETSNLNKDSSTQLWQALIYFGTPKKTAVSVGTYSNRIQAALKAEQLIKKWKISRNKP